MGIKFEGEFSVPVSPDETYAFLADPEKFCPCLPTYQSLEMEDAKVANVTIGIGVGKIRGKSTVQLTLDQENPVSQAGYTGKGKVMGGAFNFTTEFDLEPSDGGTRVKWQGDLSMFGKLVALAGGLIRPIAKKDIQRMIDLEPTGISSNRPDRVIELLNR